MYRKLNHNIINKINTKPYCYMTVSQVANSLRISRRTVARYRDTSLVDTLTNKIDSTICTMPPAENEEVLYPLPPESQPVRQVDNSAISIPAPSLDQGTPLEIALRLSVTLYDVLDVISKKGLKPKSYISKEGIRKPLFSYQEVADVCPSPTVHYQVRETQV